MVKYFFSSVLLFTISVIFSQVNLTGSKVIDFKINSSHFKVPYFSTHSLDSLNNEISRVVIVVHGTNRNGDVYFENMEKASSLRPKYTDSLLILAPQFLTEDDINNLSLSNEHLYWSNGGWKSGSKSKNNVTNPRPERISSFAILDTIILRLVNNFPNLKHITFTGHSAGGQVTHRYSMSTSIVETVDNSFGVSMKFIVANPSSYTYLDNRRWNFNQQTFSIPDESCPEYNEWKYGLDELYAYPSQLGKTSIINLFKTREVVYLLGENDNDVNSSYLDKSCKGLLQGNHRLERGRIYFDYLKTFYGPSIEKYHSLDTVPKVGHSSKGIYTSEIGLFHLFESTK